jgi:hypothetical protein
VSIGGEGFLPPGDYASAIRLAEIYMCNTARPQSDIQNILMTGQVMTADGSWDRTMYVVPTSADQVGVAGGISANNSANNTFTGSLGVTIVNDSPL